MVMAFSVVIPVCDEIVQSVDAPVAEVAMRGAAPVDPTAMNLEPSQASPFQLMEVQPDMVSAEALHERVVIFVVKSMRQLSPTDSNREPE